MLRDSNRLVALALFVVSFAVYAATASPTINFWDCGEFVTTAYTLGIPHQPGTPLFVLVGRVFGLIPLGISFAYQINLMSAFFGALAVAMTYLTGVRLHCDWEQHREEPTPLWLVKAGAAIGALFLAFSTTFWTNSIEAEVYSLASFTLAFTAYLSVRWWEVRETESSATLMLLIIYLMGLAVGFHLGAVLAFPGAVLIILLADRKALRNIDILIVAVAMGAFVLSTMRGPERYTGSRGIMELFTHDAFVIACLVGATLLGLWRLMTWGSKDEHAHGAWFSLAGIALFFLGLSVHLVMMVRAGQDPMVNQTDPETFDRLMTVLRREQYPPRDMAVREAPIWWQLGHLWGTSVWGEGTSLAGNRAVGYLQQFTFLPNPGWFDRVLPLALWLYGLYCQLRGNWRLFSGFLTTLLINSLGLMILLNFTDHEVRDRDYFYFAAFQFAALFLGLGAGGLLREGWFALKGSNLRRPVMATWAGVLLLLPTLPVLMANVGGEHGHPKWFQHNYHNNTLARDYGYNLLAGLSENAIIFTNGDNDTFPLWYMQEVEGFRRDVRVVNLSLINLPWYIKQLRDYEPSVPINWSDEQIQGEADIQYRNYRGLLQAVQFNDGSILYVRDMTVWHIVRENNWERDIYFAVTIPNENIGDFVPYMSMEGLAYRLTPNRNPDEDLPFVNTDKIWHNFTQVYDLDGMLDDEGMIDRSVYRDHNSRHLLRNYPAALCRIGYFEALANNFDFALEGAEMAYRMDPTFPVVGDLLPKIYLQAGRPEDALDAGRRLVKSLADPAPMAAQLGEDLFTLRKDDLALDWAKEVFATDEDEPLYIELLFRAHLFKQEYDTAEGILQDWVERASDPQSRLDAENELRAFRKMREEGAFDDEAVDEPTPTPPPEDEVPEEDR